MRNWFQVRNWFNFSKVQPVPAGVYHMKSSPRENPPYRLHLRLQPGGSGVLVVNASTVLHLNPTAAECAYHFIKGTKAQAAAREIADRYRVDERAALHDYHDFVDRMRALIDQPDLDPVSHLDFERVAPRATELIAPLRLDCALTYRLPAGTEADYAPTRRVDRELTTEEWISILEKAWEVGIPHVTFTGGEPTLRDDLVPLVGRAESIGQVCGLLTDGLKLAGKQYLDDLLQAGLDHLLFMLQPARAESWKALETILPEDIFVTVHLTVTNQNAAGAVAVLERLAGLGTKSLSLTFADSGISSTNLQNKAAALGLALTSDLPVPYSADHPVARETQRDALQSGAGKAWLYVEPDGDVLPAQGMPDVVLGNFLRDPWKQIYRR